MTNAEAINWIINLSADIGKAEHRALWHYEQALDEIREILESSQPEIIRCEGCEFGRWDVFDRGMWCTRHPEYDVYENDFCSRAKRRSEQDG